LEDLSPHEFVAKYRSARSGKTLDTHAHFHDLCDLVCQQMPAQVDAVGERYCFDKGGSGTVGACWAHVWYDGHFAWRYATEGSDLATAYAVLLLHHEALGSPPLLIVSDGQTIEVHTEVATAPKRIHTFTLNDLLDPKKLDLLRSIFTDPNAFLAA
jgi:hypothetical protein